MFKSEKNNKFEYFIINELIKLTEDINIKEISKHENLEKVVYYIENALNFNEQQKGGGLKILTSR